MFWIDVSSSHAFCSHMRSKLPCHCRAKSKLAELQQCRKQSAPELRQSQWLYASRFRDYFDLRKKWRPRPLFLWADGGLIARTPFSKGIFCSKVNKLPTEQLPTLRGLSALSRRSSLASSHVKFTEVLHHVPSFVGSLTPASADDIASYMTTNSRT